LDALTIFGNILVPSGINETPSVDGLVIAAEFVGLKREVLMGRGAIIAALRIAIPSDQLLMDLIHG